VKVQESFVIAQDPDRLWEFFEQVDQVAACVPGVESVEIIDDENSKVRVTQAVGPMTATFELKMRITERVPQELMQFTAVGRAVRGAAGNIRTTNTVRLAAVENGTRVDLESELALGGVMGSLGQKVVAKQAGQVTKQFAAALERSLNGDADPAASAAAAAAPGAPSASANGAAPAAPAAAAAAALPAQSPAGKRKRQVALTGLAVIGAFALLRLVLGRRSR
jgi:carbon monoxide dehydrogenase subunit G